jgi:hypothetical protein
MYTRKTALKYKKNNREKILDIYKIQYSGAVNPRSSGTRSQ